MEKVTKELPEKKVILLCESIFFNEENSPIQWMLVDPDSENYDCEYERTIRRREMNFALMLDEILFELDINDVQCGDLLYEMESFLFSPEFYRKLIFQKCVSDLKTQFQKFCDGYFRSIETFRKKVSSADYSRVVKKIGYEKAPATKKDFLTELEKVKSFLLLKKQHLDDTADRMGVLD